MPSHAAWFRTDEVHDVERRALPEFFDGTSASKTPTRCAELAPSRPESAAIVCLTSAKPRCSYKQARNFILSTYREQPALYLSFTECRRHIAIDVAAVMRLHQAAAHHVYHPPAAARERARLAAQFLEHWGLINYSSSTPAASFSAGPYAPGAVFYDGPAPPAVVATALRASSRCACPLACRAPCPCAPADGCVRACAAG